MFRNQHMHTDTEETDPFWLGGNTAEHYNMTTMDEHKDFLLPPPRRLTPPQYSPYNQPLHQQAK